ncbi:hypothetical protein N7474_004804 [Penicillium riverlandense]|uniref:uncharacterized protein n=1 Tax=Penicillium riverlandense TaxID=1903569 RepID=UPI00254815F5|nr:uncharacterized protein N7474_004804 [Penicillium riverlandense]KAJ5819213.1 hypothetical protein N7474_004804 [Penicillium riverlandense]
METLPFELLCDIVSRLDDCTSLYNLLRASPAISRLFDHDGLQLTRAVFSKDTMCDQIRESISLVAMLDSSTFPYPNLDAFIAGFIHVTVNAHRQPSSGQRYPEDNGTPGTGRDSGGSAARSASIFEVGWCRCSLVPEVALDRPRRSARLTAPTDPDRWVALKVKRSMARGYWSEELKREGGTGEATIDRDLLTGLGGESEPMEGVRNRSEWATSAASRRVHPNARY